MATIYDLWKNRNGKKQYEQSPSVSLSSSIYDRWKRGIDAPEKSKRQSMLSGGLQPEDEAYNEWLDALNSYADRTSADYKSRENKYQSKSDLGRYNIDAAAHMAQLRTGAEQSRSYYEQNRDLYDEIYGAGTIDNILASLDSGTKHLDDISKGLKSEREYWGQWDDGATYKLALQAAEEQERRAQEQAAFISEDSDGYKSYGNNWARYVELSQKETLTKEEKAEAKAALKDMQSKYHVVDQSDVFATNMPKDMEKVYVNLQNKSNWGAGVTAGFMGAFGVDWLMDKGSDLLGNILGEEYANDESVQEQFDSIQAAHPGAHTAGSIAGNLASLLAAGKLVGAGTSAISGFSKLAPAVQKAATSGLTFGLTGGYRAATNTVSEPEWNEREQEIAKYYAQQGIRYDPVEYSAWGQVEDVLKQTGISTLGGVAGSFAGSLVGDLGKAFLVKRSLQTPFAETLRQTLSGTAFAAGNTAATYWLYPKESRPSKEKITQDLAVAFLFSAITSTVNTMQTTKANKAFIDNAVAKMKQDYQNTLNTNMTAEEQIAALDGILAYNANIRASISQNYYAGQQSYINEILQGMDAIDEQINIIKNGMAPGSSPASSNAPADGAAPATVNMPAVIPQSPPVSIEPGAYPAILAQALMLDPASEVYKMAAAIDSGAVESTPENMQALKTILDLQSAAYEAAAPQVETPVEASPVMPRNPAPAHPVPQTGKNTTAGIETSEKPVATYPAQPTKYITTMSTENAIEEVRGAGRVNAPYDSVLGNSAITGALGKKQISEAYAAGLAEYNAQNQPKEEIAAPDKPADQNDVPLAEKITQVLNQSNTFTNDGLKYSITRIASGYVTRAGRYWLCMEKHTKTAQTAPSYESPLWLDALLTKGVHYEKANPLCAGACNGARFCDCQCCNHPRRQHHDHGADR